MEWETLQLLQPEAALVIVATVVFVGGAFLRARSIWLGVTLIGFLLAAYLLYDQAVWLGSTGRLSPQHVGETSSTIFVDLFGHTARWMILAIGAMLVLASGKSGSNSLSGEVLGCTVLVTAGMSITAAAADLTLIFVGLELVTIPTYVLLYLGCREKASAEATTKYFFLSILSSAILLYGFSFLYGVSGSTSLTDIRQNLLNPMELATGDESLTWLVQTAAILTLAGLGFKIAAVPFHFYAPDVYQGTTNVNAGLLAVAPKIAGIVVFVRILVIAAPTSSSFVWQVVLVTSLLTMTLGNVCALWQRNVRRLLAYSSIAHSGYLLIGIAVAMAAGSSGEVGAAAISSTMFYLFVYSVASLGSFAVLVRLSDSNCDVKSIDQLAGLGRKRPTLALLMALFMFSLSGFPPLAGFWGKLGLFTGAVSMGIADSAGATGWWFIMLATAGVVNAAIAAAYYLRIVGTMYFHESDFEPPCRGGWGALFACTACGLLVMVIGLAPSTFVESSRRAATSTWAVPDTSDERTALKDNREQPPVEMVR